MELVNIPCNICGSRDYTLICNCIIAPADAAIGPKTLDLAKCRQCGLVFVSPQPVFSKEELDNLYSQDYFQTGYMKFYAAEKKSAVQSNEAFSYRLALIERFKKNGRMLEIGCATGEFLRLSREMGWRVQGIEISRYAADNAIKNYNLEVFKGALEEACLSPASFDVIVAGDILEHMPDPKGFLMRIETLLKNDGIVYIAVPNFASFHYWFMSVIAKFTHKNYFVLPHHLYHFSAATLTRLLGDVGFSVKEKILSHSRCAEKGFKGFMVQVILLIGILLGMPDRLILIARKREAS